jgi:hypothetical protein
MVQSLPAGYVFDPEDPRAPTHEQWAEMSPAERARVVDMLPTSLPIELQPPEGVPQAGRFASAVLGLDLVLDGDRLRFVAGNAPLEDIHEMIARLGAMLNKAIAREEEAQRHAEELTEKLAEAERLREEEKGLREEEKRLRAEAERRLAEAQAELARLKGR